MTIKCASYFLLAAALVATLRALHAAPHAPPADAPLSGIDPAAFDSTVRPGDDFFQYVNGTWIKNNPIPPEYSRWGAFTKLRDDATAQLRGLCEDLAKAGDKITPDGAKIRDLYLSATNEQQIEAQGASPLNDLFAGIARVQSRQDLLQELASLRAQGFSMLFGIGVAQDQKQSDRYAVYLRQGGLGLPEREYYLGTSDDSKKIRAQYHDHIAAMLKLLGDAPQAADAEASAVISIETRLAQASRTPTQLRDQEANYNKKNLPELAALTPKIPWNTYLKTIDISTDTVVVGQPEFFQTIDGMLDSVSIADWRSYLRWHLIHTMAPYLSSNFENENFHFFSEIMRGVKQQQPRWKRAIAAIDRLMGEPLGHLYVDKYFTPEAKSRMDAMVKNLLAAYKDRIETRDWMGPETKAKALAKLAAINPKIGYPTKWRDYSALEIRPDSYAKNFLRGTAFESRYRLAKLGQPVDRTEWHMTPPTVNAYYSGTLNEIVFPAGILQSPFFNFSADDAVNYGGIGAVIGHEITHGFDDQGSHSDAQGNLKEWWTPEDRARFTAKAEKLAKQYDACVPVDDLHINGHLTLGENLADLGGVNIAYYAYIKSLNGKPAPILDGFTGPQRFFLGYAQIWRDSVRDADQRVLLRTDPHSPARFRTLVPLSNIQPFYDAFNIKPGDKMYRSPDDRVEVW